MADATITLAPLRLGMKPKQRDTDPKVIALVEEWRLARRAGDRMGARKLAGKVQKARDKARRD